MVGNFSLTAKTVNITVQGPKNLFGKTVTVKKVDPANSIQELLKERCNVDLGENCKNFHVPLSYKSPRGRRFLPLTETLKTFIESNFKQQHLRSYLLKITKIRKTSGGNSYVFPRRLQPEVITLESDDEEFMAEENGGNDRPVDITTAKTEPADEEGEEGTRQEVGVLPEQRGEGTVEEEGLGASGSEDGQGTGQPIEIEMATLKKEIAEDGDAHGNQESLPGPSGAAGVAPEVAASGGNRPDNWKIPRVRVKKERFNWGRDADETSTTLDLMADGFEIRPLKSTVRKNVKKISNNLYIRMRDEIIGLKRDTDANGVPMWEKVAQRAPLCQYFLNRIYEGAETNVDVNN